MMPGMTGIEVASQLETLRPGLPVILSTGNAFQVPDEEARPASIRVVLQKPTPEMQLASAVRQALGSAGRWRVA
jgi:CheY-like chemotaxis protein